MLRFTLLGLIALSALTLQAWAQFGKPVPTPVSGDEYYANRALLDASRLSQGVYGDIVTDADPVDLRRAQIRFDEARKIYARLCSDRALPQDQRARTCHALGNMYRRGLGVKQDYARARTHFDWACLSGDHAEACMQQAYTSHTDHDGSLDYRHARRLYDHACQLGHDTACGGLGNMLYAGLGGFKDRTQGLNLMQKACKAKDGWSCERLTLYGCLHAGTDTLTQACRVMTGRR